MRNLHKIWCKIFPFPMFSLDSKSQIKSLWIGPFLFVWELKDCWKEDRVWPIYFFQIAFYPNGE